MIDSERVVQFLIDKDDSDLLCRYLRRNEIKIENSNMRQQIERYFLSIKTDRLLPVLTEFLKDTQSENLDFIISDMYENKRFELLKDLLFSSFQEENSGLVYYLLKNKGIPADLSDGYWDVLFEYAIQNTEFTEFLDWLFDYLLKNNFELAVRLHKKYFGRSSGTYQYKHLLLNLRSPEPEALFNFYKSLSNDENREGKFWQIVQNFSAHKDFPEKWITFLIKKYQDKKDCDAFQGLEGAVKNAENSIPYSEKGRSFISKMPLELVLELNLVEFFIEKNEFQVLAEVFIKKYQEEFPQEFTLENFRKYINILGKHIESIPSKQKKEFSSLLAYYENIKFFADHDISSGKSGWLNGLWKRIKLHQREQNSDKSEFSRDDYRLVFQICNLCTQERKDKSKILELAEKFQDESKKTIAIQFLGKIGIKAKYNLPSSQEDSQNPQTKSLDEVSLQKTIGGTTSNCLFWLVALTGFVSFIIFAVLLFSAFWQLKNLFLAVATIVALGLTMASFAIVVLMLRR